MHQSKSNKVKNSQVPQQKKYTSISRKPGQNSRGYEARYEKVFYNLNFDVTEFNITNNRQTTSIFPTKNDLFAKKIIKITPNVVSGCYPSVNFYLNVQFQLLREDCFGPLREGIRQFLLNPTRRCENIRIYKRVRIDPQIKISRNQIGYLVDLCWNERRNNKPIGRKKYDEKQLMFGSLLIFTTDNFQSLFSAYVLDTDLLENGYITVSFHTRVSDILMDKELLMVESEVYFEPYHRVLKVLQNTDVSLMPMIRYIIDVEKTTFPPAYLHKSQTYTVCNSRGAMYKYPVAYPTVWPSHENFGLDKSQMAAFTSALTKEFAVIQGPPGTGKTFLAIKIATAILQNPVLNSKPLVIICCTNHALDQFLESILEVTKSIIRVGSQSKSKILEPYNLTKVRSKVKLSKEILQKRYSTKRQLNQLTSSSNGIVHEENIKQCNKVLDEISTAVDLGLLLEARVVGITTTVAARRHDLMLKIRPPVGDHKQLQPSASNYTLSKDSNLEVSLFERMILNGVHSMTLTTQRRMRPNFVPLLVPAVYERLDCHPSVQTYPAVKGMKDTLYFYTHEEPEDTEVSQLTWELATVTETTSKPNGVSLAIYLRLTYKPDEVAILTTYKAQASLIERLSKNNELLKGVTVSVVDGYQGKECKIVILSLVRSNTRGNIGFLSANNRVCVALSRAREGFYIFGNMNCLKTSKIWRTIDKQLKDQQAIGDTIVLLNNEKPVSVKTAKQLEIISLRIHKASLKVKPKVNTAVTRDYSVPAFKPEVVSYSDLYETEQLSHEYYGSTNYSYSSSLCNTTYHRPHTKILSTNYSPRVEVRSSSGFKCTIL